VHSTTGQVPAQAAAAPPTVAAGEQPLPEACARCGRDADADFGALWLCLDCYHVAGSTCAGIGFGPTRVEPTC
jgi:ribosomal protein L37E